MNVSALRPTKRLRNFCAAAFGACDRSADPAVEYGMPDLPPLPANPDEAFVQIAKENIIGAKRLIRDLVKAEKPTPFHFTIGRLSFTVAVVKFSNAPLVERCRNFM
jgi:hypothetical protein